MRLRHRSRQFKLSLLALCLVWLTGCASGKKKSEEIFPELVGKKIALASIEGEDSAKKIAEVAVINQLVKKGSFILISKQDFEEARRAPNQDPSDLEGAARKAGADYALFIEIAQFDGKVRQGYSEEEVIDTQLAEEMGTDGKTQQVFRVKSLQGIVQFDLRFVNLLTHEVKTGTAHAEKTVNENARNSAIHLPPVLRFLEDLSNTAFNEFFR